MALQAYSLARDGSTALECADRALLRAKSEGRNQIMLSPQAADRFRAIETHREARDMEKPSDHVPVVVDLDLEA